MNSNKIILIGCGGHAKSIVDCIETKNNYKIAGFVDKGLSKGETFLSYPVLGNDEALFDAYELGFDKAFVSVGFLGNSNIRNNIYEKLKSIGYTLPNIADKSSVIAKRAELSEGIFIGKKAVVNSFAVIGKMAIINTGAIIEHDCVVGDFSHISVNSVLCGNVSVGENCFIGAGSTIIQGVNICGNTIIGAGSVILKDVPPNSTITGVYKG